MVDRVLIVAVEEVESCCYLSTDGQLPEKPAIQTRAMIQKTVRQGRGERT